MKNLSDEHFNDLRIVLFGVSKRRSSFLKTVVPCIAPNPILDLVADSAIKKQATERLKKFVLEELEKDKAAGKLF